MFNDKRIEKLEERIEKLERESKLVVTPEYHFWSVFSPFPEVSLKEVVEKIMDHLGLKVSYERAQEEKYTLQTISGLTKRAADVNVETQTVVDSLMWRSPTKRPPDVAKSGAKKGSISGKRSAKSPRR